MWWESWPSRRGRRNDHRERRHPPGLPTDMSDAALVALVLAGDLGAYTPLVGRHYPSCARYARRVLGNAHDAEDVLQETFLLAFRALGRYRERDRFRAWLFRILVNHCRSHARRSARRARRFLHNQQAQPAPEAPSPAEASHHDALQLALDTLDPLLREALLLKYGEELAYEEMAQMTGASISALKMRVKRARDSIRVRLEESLHE